MSSTRPPSYDERFVVPVEASRRGAHRARVSPAFTLLPYIAVAAVVLGVSALAWTLIGTSLFGGSSSSSAGAQAGGGGSTSQPAVQSSRTTPAATHASSPAGTPTVSSSTSPTAGSSTSTSTSSAPVDKTVSVVVMNGSSPAISGLAGRTTSHLTNGGWTGAQVSSRRPSTPPGVTVVYYATPALKATADAIVTYLGVGEARYSPARAGTSITVVVSSDYTG